MPLKILLSVVVAVLLTLSVPVKPFVVVPPLNVILFVPPIMPPLAVTAYGLAMATPSAAPAANVPPLKVNVDPAVPRGVPVAAFSRTVAPVLMVVPPL